jgi:hypothetical protein
MIRMKNPSKIVKILANKINISSQNQNTSYWSFDKNTM